VKSANFPTDTPQGTKDMFTAGYVGKLFFVDSRDGITRGAFQNDRIRPPTVVYEGDSQNSLVVTNAVSPKTDSAVRSIDLFVLHVEVFDENPQKPFVILNNANVYRGECVKSG
jgi:hypothetical protein